MPVTLDIDLDTAQLRRLLNRLRPADALAGIATLLRNVSIFTERHAKEGAPKDTSNLARSIAWDAQPLSARVYSPLAYAAVMEAGRRPGAKMPPPDALRGWMRRHGMGPAGAWALARSIARRGIKGRFFMKAARDKAEAKLPDFLRTMRADLEARWGRR